MFPVVIDLVVIVVVVVVVLSDYGIHLQFDGSGSSAAEGITPRESTLRIEVSFSTIFFFFFFVHVLRPTCAVTAAYSCVMVSILPSIP